DELLCERVWCSRMAFVPCAHCGALFERIARAGRPKKYCSKPCGSAANRYSRTKVCDVCGKPVLAKGLCGTHYRKRHGGSKGNPETRRASLRRRTQQRRAATRGVEIERVDRNAIGDRDDWICGICHLPVDSSLQYPDPGSPSLDHVIPLAM